MQIRAAFRNAYLLALCFLYAPVRGRARVHIEGPRHIVIMPASRLGDMVCATPIFHAIKQSYSDCKVTVVGLANCEKVHDYNSDVDAYSTMSESSVWSNIRALKALKPDVAIITTPGFEAVATFFLAGISLIIGPQVVNGFCPYQTKSYRMLMPLFLTAQHRMREYAPREYLKMLEPIGIRTDDTTKHVGFSPEAQHKVAGFLKEKGVHPDDCVVGISVSAGNKIKEWAPERFAQVANHVSKKIRATVIFIGSKNDVPRTIQAINALDVGVKYINTAGLLSLDELKALIARMNMFVSVDTGPIYVAEALNIPTVDITGPIDENEQPPIGRLHKVVHITDRKEPELFVMNARVYNEVEARRQIEAITPEMVSAVVDELHHVITN